MIIMWETQCNLVKIASITMITKWWWFMTWFTSLANYPLLYNTHWMTIEWGKTCFQKWWIEKTRIQKFSCLVLEYNWFPSTSDWKLGMAILWGNEWTWSWTMNFEGNLFSDRPISGRGKLQIQIQQYRHDHTNWEILHNFDLGICPDHIIEV